MLAGTTPGVKSQPNAPGAFCADRSALKWRSHPLDPLSGLANTPRNTSPSGPTIGEAVALSGIVAPLPLFRGSKRNTLDLVDRVALSRAMRYPVDDDADFAT